MRTRKSLTFLTLATVLVFALPAWAQQKPFTQEQVSNMVQAALGDDSGAKLSRAPGANQRTSCVATPRAVYSLGLLGAKTEIPRGITPPNLPENATSGFAPFC